MKLVGAGQICRLDRSPLQTPAAVTTREPPNKYIIDRPPPSSSSAF